jgi:hypothetical protein
MSRKLFAFLLSELKTIRVKCLDRKCAGKVIEVSVDQLADQYPTLVCPLCHQPFTITPPKDNPFVKFGEAVAELQRFGGKTVDIEFVLPDDGQPAGPK